VVRYNLIEWLVQTRVTKRVSQSLLGELVGLPQTTIAKIENNTRKLTIYEFIDICIAMNISKNEVREAVEALYNDRNRKSLWQED